MINLTWLIPLFPLIGFLTISFLNKKISKSVAGAIGSSTILLSFISSILIFIELQQSNTTSYLINIYEWIKVENLSISFSFLVDPLSSVFLLIITGVGFLIHLYSIGYMHEDEGFNKFFSYLNLFVFFMLLLVLGSNYLVMFIGWEGVGLCSYLLIGFWFKNQAYSSAANKAFIMNRIGDLGFILGIILIYVIFGSVDYNDVFEKAYLFPSNDQILIGITLLLLIGALGKSAQIPLFTWLPDAMAGPTPVSALIHAATMVTAGIYMIARNNILFSLAPFTSEIIAIIGLATLLVTAAIAITQNDIKKVLAYSTVSQLGYMFLALGIGAYSSAIFHVTTHAFFKALLFLGAGSVIHALHNEQDLRKMGGLKSLLPVTYFTFLIGTIAIAGIPPFAGFFSKDEILAHTFEHNEAYWVLALIGSGMTSFYMFRLFFLAFHGSFRGTQKQLSHVHESPKSMTIPLIFLAILSALGGVIGIPEVLHGHNALKHFLSPVFAHSIFHPVHIIDYDMEFLLMTTAIIVAALMLLISWIIYVRRGTVPVQENAPLSPLKQFVYRKFYIDELYEKLILNPLHWLSRQFYGVLENRIIDPLVNSTGRASQLGGETLKLLQSGNTGFYIFIMIISILFIFLTLSF